MMVEMSEMSEAVDGTNNDIRKSYQVFKLESETEHTFNWSPITSPNRFPIPVNYVKSFNIKITDLILSSLLITNTTTTEIDYLSVSTIIFRHETNTLEVVLARSIYTYYIRTGQLFSFFNAVVTGVSGVSISGEETVEYEASIINYFNENVFDSAVKYILVDIEKDENDKVIQLALLLAPFIETTHDLHHWANGVDLTLEFEDDVNVLNRSLQLDLVFKITKQNSKLQNENMIVKK
jgi:hypothetical protein